MTSHDQFVRRTPANLPGHIEAELRAVDAGRPGEYRTAQDLAGAGVTWRVVLILVVAIVLIVWALTTFRP